MGPIFAACSLVSSAFGATMCVFWIRIQPRWRAGPRTNETVGCAICGYPVVGEDLRWQERIFVTGPLAELQIGPCARNIIGARNVGRRLPALLQKGIR